MKKDRAHILPPSLPPRGLMRHQAAAWVNVSANMFDKMVSGGLMPQPRRVGRRVIWDLQELNEKFDQLPRNGEGSSEKSNPWD